MLPTSSTLSLFPEPRFAAERSAAIDILHDSTALYTCQPIVDDILDRLNWRTSGGCLADVSAGDGIFLGEALNRLLATASPSDDELARRIQGYEIHPVAASEARRRIASILISHGRAAPAADRTASRIVHNVDFLTDGPETPAFSNLCGNPPFLRLTKVPKVLRCAYSAHVPKYAAADLLYSFLDRITRTLQPGGEFCLVSNDRWLFSKGAANLRQVIGEQLTADGSRLTLKHVERIDPASSFYRPKHRVKGTPPRISPVIVHLGFGPGRELTKAPIYPGVDPAQFAHLPKLGDIATVTLAPWLGADGIHILTRDQLAQSKIPEEYAVPTIDARDVVEGTLAAPQRYALRVSPTEEPVQAVLDHLKRANPKFGAGRHKAPWMSPESFHNRDLSKPSLLILRITNTAVPMRVQPGILVNDHHLTITCEDNDDLDRIERALSSNFASAWLAAHGSMLEGGYYQISAPILRQMPIQFDECVE